MRKLIFALILSLIASIACADGFLVNSFKVGESGGGGGGETLLDLDWGTTGYSDAVLEDGFWSTVSGTTDCSSSSNRDSCFEVTSSGYDGANALEIKQPGTGSAWIYNHTSFSNPSDIYIRVYAKVTRYSNGLHYFWLDSSVQGAGTGDGVILLRLGSDEVQVMTEAALATTYRYSTSSTDWHLWEFHISGGGSSSGTIEVKRDSVDVSGSFCIEGGDCLDDDAGAITLENMNYIGFNTYDHTSSGLNVSFSHLKVATDNWIGGI